MTLADFKFNFPVWHDRDYVDALGRTHGRDFFDQTVPLQQALAALIGGARFPVVILVGDRRAGKTSLLKLVEGYLRAGPARPFLPVAIRARGIGSVQEFMREILQGICSGTGQDLPATETPGAGPPGQPASPAQLATTLEALPLAPDLTLVLCIDEFDQILRSASDEVSEVLHMLHYLGTRTRLSLALLLTMTSAPSAAVRECLAPTIVRIVPFTLADTQEMVRALWQDRAPPLADAVLAELQHLSGGWPYFTKLLLIYLAQQETANVAAALHDACNDPNAELTLQNIYHMRWDETDKGLMLACVADSRPLAAARLLRLGSAGVQAATHLVAQNYLLQDADGSYRLRIEFLRFWFRNWADYEEEIENRLPPITES